MHNILNIASFTGSNWARNEANGLILVWETGVQYSMTNVPKKLRRQQVVLCVVCTHTSTPLSPHYFLLPMRSYIYTLIDSWQPSLHQEEASCQALCQRLHSSHWETTVFDTLIAVLFWYVTYVSVISSWHKLGLLHSKGFTQASPMPVWITLQSSTTTICHLQYE